MIRVVEVKKKMEEVRRKEEISPRKRREAKATRTQKPKVQLKQHLRQRKKGKQGKADDPAIG